MLHQVFSGSSFATPLCQVSALQVLTLVFLALASAAPPSRGSSPSAPPLKEYAEVGFTIDHHGMALTRIRFTDGLIQWPPGCPGDMLPEFGPNDRPNYRTDTTLLPNQFQELARPPTLTTLSAFCHDRNRGADCMCVHLGEGIVVLDCKGYLGDYPAFERCLRVCECSLGPQQRAVGRLDIVAMNNGRTSVTPHVARRL